MAWFLIGFLVGALSAGAVSVGAVIRWRKWRKEAQWKECWDRLGLHPDRVVTTLGLYPWPANWIFGAQLHFIALLEKIDPAP